MIWCREILTQRSKFQTHTIGRWSALRQVVSDWARHVGTNKYFSRHWYNILKHEDLTSMYTSKRLFLLRTSGCGTLIHLNLIMLCMSTLVCVFVPSLTRIMYLSRFKPVCNSYSTSNYGCLTIPCTCYQLRYQFHRDKLFQISRIDSVNSWSA